jgi:hypothetical protein
MSVKGRGSGAPLELEMGVFYEFEDGLFRRGRAFPSHAETLQVAGIPA